MTSFMNSPLKICNCWLCISKDEIYQICWSCIDMILTPSQGKIYSFAPQPTPLLTWDIIINHHPRFTLSTPFQINKISSLEASTALHSKAINGWPRNLVLLERIELEIEHLLQCLKYLVKSLQVMTRTIGFKASPTEETENSLSLPFCETMYSTFD